MLLLLLLFHFFVWSGVSAWEGRDGTGGSAGESCGLRRSDKTTSSLPLNSPHWGFKGFRGAGGGPRGRQKCCNIVPPVSGDVTAGDISRIVAVTSQ